MAYKTTSASFGSTGVKTISTTFLPTRVDVYVGSVFGGDSGLTHWCFGSSDGTNTLCNWSFDDGTLKGMNNVTGQLISHQENVGGVITEVLAATFNSFNATSLKINVTVADANYQVFFRISS